VKDREAASTTRPRRATAFGRMAHGGYAETADTVNAMAQQKAAAACL
jgi:hypothetical protein